MVLFVVLIALCLYCAIKDIVNRASFKCSDNYTGIALCNSIYNLIDIVLIDRFSESMCTSNLQFDFMKNHLTVLCSAVFLETVSYSTRQH